MAGINETVSNDDLGMMSTSYLPDTSARSYSRLGTTMPKQTRFDMGSGAGSRSLQKVPNMLGIETNQNSLMRQSWAGRQGQSRYRRRGGQARTTQRCI